MTDNILHGDIIPTQRDDWRLYQGVRTRRVFAFLIDYIFVLLLCIPVAFIIAILGIVTLGLGWLLYSIMIPLIALPYVALTLGGPRQATLGMRVMDIKLERLDGKPVDGMLAIVHTVLFWAGNVILTPLILLATLFLDRKRTVHDMLLGTVVVRTDR
ncbi:RDD family protein [Brucella sp. IR073]|uniref:RDD family protein n=1 Tax=unclassified Brucella TaxID=2632610 RepID=UPI003B986858